MPYQLVRSHKRVNNACKFAAAILAGMISPKITYIEAGRLLPLPSQALTPTKLIFRTTRADARTNARRFVCSLVQGTALNFAYLPCRS